MKRMSLREKITESMLEYAPIPEEKRDIKKQFYYKRYEDNLFCPMDQDAYHAYNDGSGAEMQPMVKNKDGIELISPAKMASAASSSAMTFNLLGNGVASIRANNILPIGTYHVEYEKQMYTVNKGSKTANLDAFLSNEEEGVAIFCEMKMLEWLGTPSYLKEAYRDNKNYFDTDYSNIGCPVDAFETFDEVIEKLLAPHKTERPNPGKSGYRSIFKRYDVWQMLKHLLAIYNYTSFATKNSVNSFGKIPSMAGKYNQIILANVVNEFPPERIQDLCVREEYLKALEEERDEAAMFIDIIKNSGIPRLFDNNCNAGIEIKYMSAKQFADSLDMTQGKREYLKRYFE